MPARDLDEAGAVTIVAPQPTACAGQSDSVAPRRCRPTDDEERSALRVAR
jgi:hypothetical protein